MVAPPPTAAGLSEASACTAGVVYNYYNYYNCNFYDGRKGVARGGGGEEEQEGREKGEMSAVQLRTTAEEATTTQPESPRAQRRGRTPRRSGGASNKTVGAICSSAFVHGAVEHKDEEDKLSKQQQFKMRPVFGSLQENCREGVGTCSSMLCRSVLSVKDEDRREHENLYPEKLSNLISNNNSLARSGSSLPCSSSSASIPAVSFPTSSSSSTNPSAPICQAEEEEEVPERRKRPPSGRLSSLLRKNNQYHRSCKLSYYFHYYGVVSSSVSSSAASSSSKQQCRTDSGLPSDSSMDSRGSTTFTTTTTTTTTVLQADTRLLVEEEGSGGTTKTISKEEEPPGVEEENSLITYAPSQSCSPSCPLFFPTTTTTTPSTLSPPRPTTTALPPPPPPPCLVSPPPPPSTVPPIPYPFSSSSTLLPFSHLSASQADAIFGAWFNVVRVRRYSNVRRHPPQEVTTGEAQLEEGGRSASVDSVASCPSRMLRGMFVCREPVEEGEGGGGGPDDLLKEEELRFVQGEGEEVDSGEEKALLIKDELLTANKQAEPAGIVMNSVVGTNLSTDSVLACWPRRPSYTTLTRMCRLSVAGEHEYIPPGNILGRKEGEGGGGGKSGGRKEGSLAPRQRGRGKRREQLCAQASRKAHFYKTKMCPYRKAGICPKLDQECQYAHCLSELRGTSQFYKRDLCAFWLAGHCRAQQNCRHAHGTAEMQQAEEETKKIE
eukprot:GHVS01080135.1.p1 GENE.GHVS01080135.1~~GHVS01080135.1.p1  ORF type:complete len:770 (-),score=225.65 GHVS01080135.1:150-2306(-)